MVSVAAIVLSQLYNKRSSGEDSGEIVTADPPQCGVSPLQTGRKSAMQVQANITGAHNAHTCTIEDTALLRMRRKL